MPLTEWRTGVGVEVQVGHVTRGLRNTENANLNGMTPIK